MEISLKSKILSFIVFVVLNVNSQILVSKTSNIANNFDLFLGNIILYGEQHVGKQRPQIHKEFYQIIKKCKIDTLFIEHSMSSYINSRIAFNSKYLDLGPFEKDTTIVLIPVDVEDDIPETLFSIESLLRENKVLDENIKFFLRSIQHKSRNELLTNVIMTSLIDKLKTNYLPRVVKYKSLLFQLLIKMESTYEVFDVNNLSNCFDSYKRDSMMASEINYMVKSHKIKRWGGLFGAFHISKESDKLYDPKSIHVDNNLYSYLTSSYNFQNSDFYRFIYRSMDILRLDSYCLESFYLKYENYLNYLDKNNCVLEKLENLTYIITRK